MGTSSRWTADRVADAMDVLTASVTRQQELDQMVARISAGLRTRDDARRGVNAEDAAGRRLASVQPASDQRVA